MLIDARAMRTAFFWCIAARFAEISDRTGEIVPDMGGAQGMIELTKAQKHHKL